MLVIRCLLCSKRIRLGIFPHTLLFWRPRGYVYHTELEMGEHTYKVLTVLCEDDLDWAERNPDVADTLIASKFRGTDPSKPGDFSGFSEE